MYFKYLFKNLKCLLKLLKFNKIGLNLFLNTTIQEDLFMLFYRWIKTIDLVDQSF